MMDAPYLLRFVRQGGDFDFIALSHGGRNNESPTARISKSNSWTPRAIHGTEEPFTGLEIGNTLAIEQHLGEG